jgi:defect-in-organelle-trafficking protein DotD
MKRLIPTFIVICILALAGCVSEHLPPAPPQSDPSSVKLAEAATQVDHSLQTLEGIRKAEYPDYDKDLPDPRTFGMTFLASIDWTGPIGPLVERIGDASGYRVRVLGRPPAIPIIISLEKKNVPLAIILRDADFQAADQADIFVYPARRTIELRYKPAIVF